MKSEKFMNKVEAIMADISFKMDIWRDANREYLASGDSANANRGAKVWTALRKLRETVECCQFGEDDNEAMMDCVLNGLKKWLSGFSWSMVESAKEKVQQIEGWCATIWNCKCYIFKA